ncbi:MAG: hypothetical protein K6U80_08520 [Firmicutes bacterium]|nr:hypothetical protein [Bacillota bacterium]
MFDLLYKTTKRLSTNFNPETHPLFLSSAEERGGAKRRVEFPNACRVTAKTPSCFTPAG